MSLKPETIALIRKVQVAIKAEPQLYDQTRLMEQTSCGTACCIAGWTVRCSGDFMGFISEFQFASPHGTRSIFEAARRLLELDGAGAQALFYEDPSARRWDEESEEYLKEHCWPEPFAARWAAATSDAERAQVACDRLDAYITEKGCE